MLIDYWELWYSSEAIRIIEASRDLAKTLEEQAREQVKSGTLANVDALPFATQLAEQEESMVQQTTDRRQRALALAQAIGQAERTGPDLRSADTPPDVNVDDTSAQAVDDALAASYELKRLQAELSDRAIPSQDRRRLAASEPQLGCFAVRAGPGQSRCVRRPSNSSVRWTR